MSKSTCCHVHSSELRVGMYITKLGDSWIDHPFIRTSFLIKDAKDLQKVINAGITEVWIDETKGIAKLVPVVEEKKEAAENKADLDNAHLSRFDAMGRTPYKNTVKDEIVNARKICLSAKEQVQSMFDDARLGKAINPTSFLPLVESIISSVTRNPSAFISVARLKTHDNYTYMHSVSVCALMIALAKQLKLNNEQVKLAGHGGLLHDLGKAFMPLDILNKPGRLTDAEFEIMKGHPVAGVRALDRNQVSSEVYDIVLHHHEKLDGSGYPDGLKGNEISLFAKMAACCDVYDAVTSIRAYKNPWAPAYALQQMAGWKAHFDADVFRAFVSTIGIYPVGSLVRLSSERLAVVVEPCEESLLKPIVCEFFAVSRNEMVPIKIIDLSTEKNIKIIGPENPEKWGFEHLEEMWQ